MANSLGFDLTLSRHLGGERNICGLTPGQKPPNLISAKLPNKKGRFISAALIAGKDLKLRPLRYEPKI